MTTIKLYLEFAIIEKVAIMRSLTTWLFYGVTVLVGLLSRFHLVIFSGFRFTPGDLGDGRLNHYFLEHSFRLVSQRDYIGGLFSPRFFYPTPNALALSDHLFGTAPIYWLMRLISSPTVAFTGWMMILSILNFSAMVWVLRRWSVHPLLAGCGGFLMAFSATRTIRLTHAQLLPQFIIPIALFCLWQFWQKPTLKRLLCILGLIAWQLLSGFYLGWFLLLSIGITSLIRFILAPSVRPQLWQFIHQRWVALIAITLIWLGVIIVLHYPYIQIKALVGDHSFDGISTRLPRWSSWLVAPDKGGLWSNALAMFRQDLPMVGEHQIFSGFVLYGLVGWTVAVLISRSAWLKPDRRLLVQLFLSSGMALVLISLVWPNGQSAWWFVYKFVPGATAIRAVSRIFACVDIYWLIAVIIALNDYLSSHSHQRQLQAILLSGLMCFSAIEQFVNDDYAYNSAQFQVQQTELTQVLRQSNCQLGYLTVQSETEYTKHLAQTKPNNFSNTYSQTLKLPFLTVWIYNQVMMMWAGLSANVPVINGYSGNVPPGFPWYPDMTLPQLLQWIETQPIPQRDRICYIRASSDDNRTDTINPTEQSRNWQLQNTLTSRNYQVQIMKQIR
jgi:hypothetical protein